MHALFVLYDSRCGLCTRVRRWMEGQPAYVELRFVAAGSPRAARLFPPDVAGSSEPGELVVVSDEGGVYRGDAAWLMCLWALENYRAWGLRLAHPGMRGLARAFFDLLSKNRGRISAALEMLPDAELYRRLQAGPVVCENPGVRPNEGSR